MKITLILLLLFLLLPVCTGRAQTNTERCVKSRTAPPANSYYWPPDTEVKVYLHRAMFTVEEREILLATIEAWSETARLARTGVTFTYAGEIDGIIDCRNCLRLTRREVHRNDKKHYAFFNPIKLDDNGLLISARIDLDFATTNSKALRSFTAHELGHGMGLSDCHGCKKKNTVMSGFPGINRDNGLIGPSKCDVEVVKEIYEQQRRVNDTLAKGSESQIVGP